MMKLYKYLVFSFLLILTTTVVYSQKITIDAQIEVPDIIENHLKMGHSGPLGKEITINNKYLSLSDKPMIPVMGEIHFSRCNPDKWEELILKMKANGITIISTYVFWNHHEEKEGVFEWNDAKNLRRFVELCRKHDLWVYPRIGPWNHGEVRNGGLPDWIVNQKEFKTRTNNTRYLFYAERLYKEISEQLKDLYYKDGGPVVGIQLENEYWRGKGGESHILKLKEIALKYGIDVPMYTITGWRNTSLPENEVIPLWGGYPAAPWNTDLKKIKTNESYVFNKPINDQSIGHKEASSKYRPNYLLYPYFTCELGIGNQISEHRRPIIDPIDGVTIATSSVASGSNLPGYYVFTGGLNPLGKYTTLEENRYESGYWNEYPDISYDFQAALRETGEISEAYHKLKPLHYFLSEFGEQLAPMTPIIPDNNDAPDNLQYSFRVKDNSGFLFASNYYRGHQKSTKKGVQFSIEFKNESLTIPSYPLEIKDSVVFVWPVNMQIGSSKLKYATAQPICNLDNDKTQDWYFKQTDNIATEFLFSSENIESIKINGTKQKVRENLFLIKSSTTGLKSPIVIKCKDGSTQRIFVLSKKDVDDFWYFKNENKEYGFISTANLVLDEKQQLHVFSTHKEDEVITLNSQLKSVKNSSRKNIDGFKKYTVQNYKNEIAFSLEKQDLIDEAEWLKISPEQYQEKKEMYHKQFFKDFNLENTANIKKAIFHLFTDEKCMIRVNEKWLNQKIEVKEVNQLDLTGYIKKGNNRLFLDFPYKSENKAFVGVLEVEYYNAYTDKIVTDTTWLQVEQYKIPAHWDGVRNKTAPIIVEKPKEYMQVYFSPNRYQFKLDKNKIDASKNTFLRIDYSGDKIRCLTNEKLVADNFNNDTTWSINLTDIDWNQDQTLFFDIKPFEKPVNIYFDKQPNFETTGINSMTIDQECLTIFEVVN